MNHQHFAPTSNVIITIPSSLAASLVASLVASQLQVMRSQYASDMADLRHVCEEEKEVMRAHNAETEAMVSALTAQLKAGLTQAVEKLTTTQADLKAERERTQALKEEVRRLRGESCGDPAEGGQDDDDEEEEEE